MKYAKPFLVGLMLFSTLAVGTFQTATADKVVVIPMLGNETPAPVPKTGQTESWADGDDGYYEKGVSSPSPRFVDHGNGTVTDKLTNLIWLKQGNCSSFYAGDATGANERGWYPAVSSCHRLASGRCGLTDGSAAGYWRLPNRRELDSLLHLRHRFYDTTPMLPPDCPLTATTEMDWYYSSTPAWHNPPFMGVWRVSFSSGLIYSEEVSISIVPHHVRCVRGGQ